MANIKFEYLFRDQNNYKEYGEVILSNSNNLSLDIIRKKIIDNLIEGTWFHPDNWGVPRFSFHRISMFGVNDHLWYEFAAITETKRDVTTTTGIEEFTMNIKNNIHMNYIKQDHHEFQRYRKLVRRVKRQVYRFI